MYASYFDALFIIMHQLWRGPGPGEGAQDRQAPQALDRLGYLDCRHYSGEPAGGGGRS